MHAMFNNTVYKYTTLGVGLLCVVIATALFFINRTWMVVLAVLGLLAVAASTLFWGDVDAASQRCVWNASTHSCDGCSSCKAPGNMTATEGDCLYNVSTKQCERMQTLTCTDAVCQYNGITYTNGDTVTTTVPCSGCVDVGGGSGGGGDTPACDGTISVTHDVCAWNSTKCVRTQTFTCSSSNKTWMETGDCECVCNTQSDACVKLIRTDPCARNANGQCERTNTYQCMHSGGCEWGGVRTMEGGEFEKTIECTQNECDSGSGDSGSGDSGDGDSGDSGDGDSGDSGSGSGTVGAACTAFDNTCMLRTQQGTCETVGSDGTYQCKARDEYTCVSDSGCKYNGETYSRGFVFAIDRVCSDCVGTVVRTAADTQCQTTDTGCFVSEQFSCVGANGTSCTNGNSVGSSWWSVTTETCECATAETPTSPCVAETSSTSSCTWNGSQCETTTTVIYNPTTPCTLNNEIISSRTVRVSKAPCASCDEIVSVGQCTWNSENNQCEEEVVKITHSGSEKPIPTTMTRPCSGCVNPTECVWVSEKNACFRGNTACGRCAKPTYIGTCAWSPSESKCRQTVTLTCVGNSDDDDGATSCGTKARGVEWNEKRDCATCLESVHTGTCAWDGTQCMQPFEFKCHSSGVDGCEGTVSGVALARSYTDNEVVLVNQRCEGCTAPTPQPITIKEVENTLMGTEGSDKLSQTVTAAAEATCTGVLTDTTVPQCTGLSASECATTEGCSFLAGQCVFCNTNQPLTVRGTNFRTFVNGSEVTDAALEFFKEGAAPRRVAATVVSDTELRTQTSFTLDGVGAGVVFMRAVVGVGSAERASNRVKVWVNVTTQPCAAKTRSDFEIGTAALVRVERGFFLKTSSLTNDVDAAGRVQKVFGTSVSLATAQQIMLADLNDTSMLNGSVNARFVEGGVIAHGTAAAKGLLCDGAETMKQIIQRLAPDEWNEKLESVFTTNWCMRRAAVRDSGDRCEYDPIDASEAAILHFCPAQWNIYGPRITSQCWGNLLQYQQITIPPPPEPTDDEGEKEYKNSMRSVFNPCTSWSSLCPAGSGGGSLLDWLLPVTIGVGVGGIWLGLCRFLCSFGILTAAKRRAMKCPPCSDSTSGNNNNDNNNDDDKRCQWTPLPANALSWSPSCAPLLGGTATPGTKCFPECRPGFYAIFKEPNGDLYPNVNFQPTRYCSNDGKMKDNFVCREYCNIDLDVKTQPPNARPMRGNCPESRMMRADTSCNPECPPGYEAVKKVYTNLMDTEIYAGTRAVNDPTFSCDPNSTNYQEQSFLRSTLKDNFYCAPTDRCAKPMTFPSDGLLPIGIITQLPSDLKLPVNKPGCSGGGGAKHTYTGDTRPLSEVKEYIRNNPTSPEARFKRDILTMRERILGRGGSAPNSATPQTATVTTPQTTVGPSPPNVNAAPVPQPVSGPVNSPALPQSGATWSPPQPPPNLSALPEASVNRLALLASGVVTAVTTAVPLLIPHSSDSSESSDSSVTLPPDVKNALLTLRQYKLEVEADTTAKRVLGEWLRVGSNKELQTLMVQYVEPTDDTEAWDLTASTDTSQLPTNIVGMDPFVVSVEGGERVTLGGVFGYYNMPKECLTLLVNGVVTEFEWEVNTPYLTFSAPPLQVANAGVALIVRDAAAPNTTTLGIYVTGLSAQSMEIESLTTNAWPTVTDSNVELSLLVYGSNFGTDARTWRATVSPRLSQSDNTEEYLDILGVTADAVTTTTARINSVDVNSVQVSIPVSKDMLTTEQMLPRCLTLYVGDEQQQRSAAININIGVTPYITTADVSLLRVLRVTGGFFIGTVRVALLNSADEVVQRWEEPSVVDSGDTQIMTLALNTGVAPGSEFKVVVTTETPVGSQFAMLSGVSVPQQHASPVPWYWSAQTLFLAGPSLFPKTFTPTPNVATQVTNGSQFVASPSVTADAQCGSAPSLPNMTSTTVITVQTPATIPHAQVQSATSTATFVQGAATASKFRLSLTETSLPWIVKRGPFTLYAEPDDSDQTPTEVQCVSFSNALPFAAIAAAKAEFSYTHSIKLECSVFSAMQRLPSFAAVTYQTVTMAPPSILGVSQRGDDGQWSLRLCDATTCNSSEEAYAPPSSATTTALGVARALRQQPQLAVLTIPPSGDRVRISGKNLFWQPLSTFCGSRGDATCALCTAADANPTVTFANGVSVEVTSVSDTFIEVQLPPSGDVTTPQSPFAQLRIAFPWSSASADTIRVAYASPSATMTAALSNATTLLLTPSTPLTGGALQDVEVYTYAPAAPTRAVANVSSSATIATDSDSNVTVVPTKISVINSSNSSGSALQLSLDTALTPHRGVVVLVVLIHGTPYAALLNVAIPLSLHTSNGVVGWLRGSTAATTNIQAPPAVTNVTPVSADGSFTATRGTAILRAVQPWTSWAWPQNEVGNEVVTVVGMDQPQGIVPWTAFGDDDMALTMTGHWRLPSVEADGMPMAVIDTLPRGERKTVQTMQCVTNDGQWCANAVPCDSANVFECENMNETQGPLSNSVLLLEDLIYVTIPTAFGSVRYSVHFSQCVDVNVSGLCTMRKDALGDYIVRYPAPQISAVTPAAYDAQGGAQTVEFTLLPPAAASMSLNGRQPRVTASFDSNVVSESPASLKWVEHDGGAVLAASVSINMRSFVRSSCKSGELELTYSVNDNQTASTSVAITTKATADSAVPGPWKCSSGAKTFNADCTAVSCGAQTPLLSIQDCAFAINDLDSYKCVLLRLAPTPLNPSNTVLMRTRFAPNALPSYARIASASAVQQAWTAARGRYDGMDWDRVFAVARHCDPLIITEETSGTEVFRGMHMTVPSMHSGVFAAHEAAKWCTSNDAALSFCQQTSTIDGQGRMRTWFYDVPCIEGVTAARQSGYNTITVLSQPTQPRPLLYMLCDASAEPSFAIGLGQLALQTGKSVCSGPLTTQRIEGGSVTMSDMALCGVSSNGVVPPNFPRKPCALFYQSDIAFVMQPLTGSFQKRTYVNIDVTALQSVDWTQVEQAFVF